MKLFAPFLTLVLLFASRAAAQFDVTYAPLTSFSPNFSAAGLAVGQVVGGAYPDIVMTNRTAGTVRVAGNNGPAALPTDQTFTVGGQPSEITLADLDNDGVLEVIVGNNTTTNGGISILWPATGVVRTTTALLQPEHRIHAGDLNGDGFKDLVRGNVYVLNPGIGLFTTVNPLRTLSNNTTLTAPTATPESDVGDFDGDGDIDVVTFMANGTGFPASVSIYANTGLAAGLPVFAAPATTSVGGGGFATTVIAIAGAAADMNNDGISDVVVNFTWGTSPIIAGNLSVQSLLGGSGGLTPLIAIANSDTFDGFANLVPPLLADLDNNGQIDAIVRVESRLPFGSGAEDQIHRFRNDGGGRLVDRTQISVALSSYNYLVPPILHIAAGDLDLDGDLDLVSQSVSNTLFNQPATGINIDILSPVISTLPITPSNAVISIVSGDPRVLPTSSNYLSGFEALVTTPAGAPINGAAVTFIVTSGDASVTLSSGAGLYTGLDGKTGFTLASSAAAGPATILAVLSNGNSATFHVDVKPLTIVAASGASQTFSWGGPAPMPLTAEVRDASGTPQANVAVAFQSGGAPVLFTSPATALTDALGRAQLTIAPSYGNGAYVMSAQISSTQPSASFPITIAPLTLLVTGGGGQAIDVEDALAQPFSVHAQNAAGAPIAGLPLTLSCNFTTAVTFAPTSPISTDASGDATFTVTRNAATPVGTFFVNVAAPFANSIASSFFVRSMSMTGSAAQGSVTIQYHHEHSPTPFILAIDLPQPPTPTVYGTLWTSIMNPGTGLYLLDSTGTVGVPDPSLVANPNFQKSWPIPPSVAGFTLVAQILGFDPYYYPDILASIFISNAPTLTL